MNSSGHATQTHTRLPVSDQEEAQPVHRERYGQPEHQSKLNTHPSPEQTNHCHDDFNSTNNAEETAESDSQKGVMCFENPGIPERTDAFGHAGQKQYEKRRQNKETSQLPSHNPGATRPPL